MNYRLEAPSLTLFTVVGIHATMFINTHIEHSTLRLDTRLSTTHKQGVGVTAVVGRTLIDTNVITAQAIVLRGVGRKREREKGGERERERANSTKTSILNMANNRIS